MAKVASLSRHGQFKLIGHPVDGLNERLPVVQSGLVAHWAFDGTVKPTPLATITADQLVGERHPDHGDLIKPSVHTEFTVPGITGARFMCVEFDYYGIGTATGMVLGFLTAGGANNMDIYNQGGRIGLNAWSSQDWGADIPENKRVRVTYLIDTADTNKSKLYFDGVLQPMNGTAMTGARAIQSDRVLIGNGRLTDNNYLLRNYVGNISFYKVDVDAMTQSNLVIPDEATGIYVGPPVMNLCTAAQSLTTSVTPFISAGGTLSLDASKRWWNGNSWQDSIRVDCSGGASFQGIGLTLSVTAQGAYAGQFKIRGTGTLSVWVRIVYSDATSSGDIHVGQTIHDLSWQTVYAAISPVTAGKTVSYVQLYARTMTAQVVTFWVTGIQVTNTFTHLPFMPGGEPKPGFGSLKGSYPLPTDHTLAATQRSIAEAADRQLTLTKSGTTFTLYENGVASAAYQNKWRRFQYHRTTANGTFSAPDNLKAIQSDLPDSNYNLSTNFNTNKDGILLKTFVYADADVRIWHRYHVDNSGSIRVNGRDVQSIGTYTNPPAGNTNPDVYIDLKVGWNCVEIWHMDHDSGGALFLVDNTQGFQEALATSTNVAPSTRLSAHPNVLYQTSVAPFDYFNDMDGYGWTPSLNGTLKSASLYDRVLSAAEVAKPYNPQLNLNSLGRVTTPLLVEDGENLWPQQDMADTTYLVSGGNGATSGFDANGIYHQVVVVSGGSSYKGFDISGLTPGTWYTISGMFWRSAGSTLYRPFQVEQVTSAAAVNFIGSPEETWYPVTTRFLVDADGKARCLVYPGSSTPGYAGTLRWRNIVVRPELTTPMKAAQNSLTVGEIIET